MNLTPLKAQIREMVGPDRDKQLRVAATIRKRGALVFNRLYGNNLPALAVFQGTDKWGAHWYAKHYQRHFQAYRNKRINLLEIGIGGYEDPRSGGESLRMWKAYFPKAQVFGVDIADKSELHEARITTFQGSQADPEFLRHVAKEIGRLDIVVDDGSHINEHVIATFGTLFPLLADEGFYAIEDMQTAYWSRYGGSEDPAATDTSIAMCKRLIDGLNWAEIANRRAEPFDQVIESIHFYHNLCVIEKGSNKENSNVPPSSE